MGALEPSNDGFCRFTTGVTNEPFWSGPRAFERPVPDGDSHENVGVHRSELPNKGMKLTSVERIGRSQLIPGVLRTDPR